MKRILLATSLLLLSSVAINAQNKSAATTTIQQKANIKKEFNDKTTEFKTLMNNKDVENARKTYYKLAGLMQESISAHNQEMSDASDQKRIKLTETVKQQNDLYNEMKMMSVELLKNKDAIFQKLIAYQATL